MPSLRGLALLAALMLAPAAEAATCRAPAEAAVRVQGLFDAANAQRAGAGLPALKWDGRLAAAALAKACDLAGGGAFSHSGPEISRRARGAGCRLSGTLAENLAHGYPQAGQVVGLWMGSPPHRANLLNRKVRVAGAAWMPQARGGGFWVMMYAGGCG